MAFRKSKGWGRYKPIPTISIDWGDNINKDMFGCWLFNENGGQKIIDLTNKNHGDGVNAPTWTPSKFGSSMNFAVASSQYINCGQKSSVVLEHTDKFSFSAWVKSTNTSTNISILGKYNSTVGQGYFMNSINPNGNLYMQVQFSAAVYMYRIGTALIADGKCHHVVGTYDGLGAATGIKLYVDGVEDIYSDTQNVGSATILTTSNFTIGQRGDVGLQPLPYDGIIENVRGYRRVLSLTDVRRLFSEPFAGLISPKLRIRSQVPTATPRSYGYIY